MYRLCRWQVIEHYVSRVRGNTELMEQLDVIGRTSELARLFGIQFYEVFTRGSQVNTFSHVCFFKKDCLLLFDFFLSIE
jgi:hypothetical protein